MRRPVHRPGEADALEEAARTRGPDAGDLARAMQGKAGNAAVARLVGTMAAQRRIGREPKDPPGKADDAGKTGKPGGLRVLEGDPADEWLLAPPHTEEERKDGLFMGLGLREQDNKANAAAFVADYGEALVDLWAKNVAEEMAIVAEKAGWTVLEEVLKFAVIKSLEIIAGAMLTPGAVGLLGEFGEILGEHIVGHGVEVATAALGETGATLIGEHLKEGEIKSKKEELDKITTKLAGYFHGLTVATIGGLPNIEPYAQWIHHAKDSELGDFRMPRKFPEVPRELIRAVVAGVVVGELHRHADDRMYAGPKDPEKVNYFDDNIIIVHMGGKWGGAELERAQIYSSAELSEAIAGQAPISALPTVALRVETNLPFGSDFASAQKLMDSYRQPLGATGPDVGGFLGAYPQGLSPPLTGGTGEVMINAGIAEIPEFVVTRTPQGGIQVHGSHSIGLDVWLYQLATGDVGLSALVDAVMQDAAGHEELRRSNAEMRGDEDEGVSRMASVTDLARYTHEMIGTEDIREKAAAVLLVSYVASVVPEAPTDRYDHSGRNTQQLTPEGDLMQY
jgi:hypothetical protein